MNVFVAGRTTGNASYRARRLSRVPPNRNSSEGRTVVVVLISIWLALFGLMTFGLPGAAVLQAATILARLFSPAGLGSDGVDVAEIAIGVFGPLALLPAHLVVRRTRLPPWTRALITIARAFALTLVISATRVIISGR